MKSFHIEAFINTSVETCWKAWTDVTVASKWLGLTYAGTKAGDDYRITNEIAYLSGRHQILEIVPNKKLKLQIFIDGWPAELTIQFHAEEKKTKLILDFSVDSKNAPKSIEPLLPSRNDFYFIQGSWDHVLRNLRCLLEDQRAGVVIPKQNNDHEINLSADIESTPDKLYNALIDLKLLQKWNAPFVGEGAEIDAKVGGAYSYGWYPKGTPDKDIHDGPSKILKLEKNKLLVHNWHGGLEMAEITWQLEDKGNGITHLTFKHSPILGFSHGNIWSYRSGWSEIIYDLKWYAERGELSKCWIESK